VEPLIVILVVIVALVAGLLLGWTAGGRAGRAGQETTVQLRSMLDQVVVERDTAKDRLARLETSLDERERSFQEQIAALSTAKDMLSAQFGEIGQKLLGEAQAVIFAARRRAFSPSGREKRGAVEATAWPCRRKIEGI